MAFLRWLRPVRCEPSFSSSSSSGSEDKGEGKGAGPSDAGLQRATGTVRAAKEQAQALLPTAVGGSTTDEVEHKRWRRAFTQWAKFEVDGQEPFLDEEGFVNAIAPGSDFQKITRAQYAILFRIADSSGRGAVTWNDFAVFESLLKKPDAEFLVAFKYFDVDGNGEVTFDEFKRVFSDALGPSSIPFDFDAPWLRLYLGRKGGQHVLGYHEFTQLMKGLQGERLRQAFRHFDKGETGYITPEDFKRVVLELAAHKLSDSVLERLPTLCTLTPGGKISYSEVIAFHNVLREMDAVERVILAAVSQAKDGKIDRNDFLDTAARTTRYGIFSPMETNIIFHFAGSGDVNARLSTADFAQLLDEKWDRPQEPAFKPAATTFFQDLGHSAYNFGLGGIAGGLGATAVYPIDFVKTRMQNQRSKVVGEVLYKNSIDCVKKVFKNEGIVGFYRGLLPQLVGVAPEKAIKLTVNDLLRAKGKDKATGQITLPWELLAGGTAGGCQVAVTNPLEIVKIRLQMQGEAAREAGQSPRGAVHIIRQLGLLGLYKGAGACMCRDIPFSMIYFPGYSHLKRDVFKEGKNGKKLGVGETLLAASVAGMPAAYFTTPADVVKTRLQSEARKGETNYKGLVHCFTTILSEEGPRALFKGGPARMLRSSPQFGVTLVAYELLQDVLPYPFGPAKLSTPKAEPEDISRIRARNALRILLDVHNDLQQRKAATA